MIKDEQIDDVSNCHHVLRKTKQNAQRSASISECFSISNNNNNNSNSNKHNNSSHTKNSYSWSYNKNISSHNDSSSLIKLKEADAIDEEEDDNNNEMLIKQKQTKQLIKESKQISIIKKFQRIYQMLSGKRFIVETNYEKQTAIEYFNKLLNLDFVIFSISITSILNGIVYYEMTYTKQGEVTDSNGYYILLYNILILTILLFIALIFKELVHIQYDIETQHVNLEETLITSKRYISLLIYFIFFFIHPSHLFYGITVTMGKDINGNNCVYSLNSIFVSLLLLRGFFVIKPILFPAKFYDPEASYGCRQYNFKSNAMFSLKCQARYSSLKLYTLTLMFEWFTLAYVLRIYERPANNIFDNYFDALWFIMETMTTVGYGDIIAQTLGGKIISIISCVSGVFLVSMVIVTVTTTLTLAPHEYSMLAILKKTEHLEKEKLLAGTIIAKYVSLVMTKCNGRNYTKVMGDYYATKELKKHIVRFHNYVEQHKNPGSSDFITFHNRLNFFCEFQRQVLSRREEVEKDFQKLQKRIKDMKERGLL